MIPSQHLVPVNPYAYNFALLWCTLSGLKLPIAKAVGVHSLTGYSRERTVVSVWSRQITYTANQQDVRSEVDTLVR
jgi:hypothetical protein